MKNLTYIMLEKQTSGNITVKGDKSFFQGYEFTSEKGGIFLKWKYENQRFIFNNDRFGVYPAFYYEHNGMFILSTSLDNLTSRIPDKHLSLDYEGLSVFFRLGWFIGDHTPFAVIKAVPPDCTITWENGVLLISGNERLSIAPFKGTRSEVIDKFIYLFQESMSDCIALTEGKISVPLSGGRDSRHILFELMRQKVVPDLTVTVKSIPPRINGDMVVAEIITDALSLEHMILDQPTNKFNNEWNKNLLSNYCSFEHTWAMPMLEFFQRRNVKNIYDGIAGDVFSKGVFLDQTALNLLENKTTEDVARYILKRSTQTALLEYGVLHRSLTEKCSVELALSSLTREFNRHKNTNDPIDSFFFWNRTRRAISSYTYGMLGSIENIFSPFLGYRIVDFFLSITPDFNFPNELHSETIARAYLEYKDIPYEEMVQVPSEKRLFPPSCRVDTLRLLLKICSTKGNIINKRKTLPRLLEAYITGNWNIYDYAGGRDLIYLLQLQSIINRNLPR